MDKQILKLIDDKLKSVYEKLKKIDDMEKSVENLNNTYDDILKRLKAIEELKSSHTEENTRRMTYINTLQNTVNQTRKDLDDLQQYVRRECLEIRGIPVAKDEDTNEIVRKVCDLVDVKVNDMDISVSHRLPSRKPSSPSYANAVQNKIDDEPIIVKFVRRDVRDKFYQARTKLRSKTTRDLGITRHRDQKIFISESLTRRNKDLMKECVKKKKDLNYKFLWSKYGKILMRKDSSSPVFTITSYDDLAKIS